MEITGPVAAKLWLSSDSADADVFLALRVFSPEGAEVTFQGSNDPRVPVGLGWLRASQRKLDPQKSLPYRPWHTHDEFQKLTPGEAVELDVEIWPTSIVIPAGFRLALAVRGRDYEYPGAPIVIPGFGYTFTGVGPFRARRSARPAEGNLRRLEHASLRVRTAALPAASGDSTLASMSNVVHIFVASRRGAAMSALTSVEALPGVGLAGDRYSEAKNRRSPDYEVTLNWNPEG